MPVEFRYNRYVAYLWLMLNAGSIHSSLTCMYKSITKLACIVIAIVC